MTDPQAKERQKAEVKTFLPQVVGYQQDAEEVLQQALEEGFESIIILGLKGDCMHIKSSKQFSTLKTLGALEAAKMQLWGIS
jgi:hypothetical protein